MSLGRLGRNVGISESAQSRARHETTVCRHEVRETLDIGLGLEPWENLSQETSLITAQVLKLGDPDGSVSSGGVGLGNMSLEVGDR